MGYQVFIRVSVGGRHATGVPTRYWEGGGNAETVCQPNTIITQHFYVNVKFNLDYQPKRRLHPTN